MNEDSIHIALVKWMTMQYPRDRFLWFHVPNGGKRSRGEAIKFKRQGVLAGVADILILEQRTGVEQSQPKCGFALELKTPTGTVSQSQKDFLLMVQEKNWHSDVSYGLDEAIEKVQDYMNNNF